MQRTLYKRSTMRAAVRAVVALWLVLWAMGPGGSFANDEILKYEVTWLGKQAAHGDIVLKRGADLNTVVVQAVSDGNLKRLVEVWSRIQVKFTSDTMEPRWYHFELKSNRLPDEVVDLSFDHARKLVRVDKKKKGDDQDVHSEQFSRIYDPVTAIYLLRYQRDLTKAMQVDVYDGKDHARLYVNPIGTDVVTVKAGRFPALGLNLKVVKLTGSREELGKGTLWISNDERRIPLLLKSAPIVGQVQFELVEASPR